jgi:hypothetical protein
MSEPEHTNPATETVKALNLFLLGPEGEGALSDEVIAKELRAAGVDPGKMADVVKKRISQARNRLRLEELRLARDSFGESIGQNVAAAGAALSDLKDSIREVLCRIRDYQPEAAAVFHRKLEESTAEDLRSLLDDLNDLERQHQEDEKKDRG